MNKYIYISIAGAVGIASAIYITQNQSVPTSFDGSAQPNLSSTETTLTSKTATQPTDENNIVLTQPKQKIQSVDQTSSAANEKLELQTLPLNIRKKMVSEWSDLSEFSDDQIEMANNSQNLWAFNQVNIAMDDLPLDASELTDGRAFFTANQAKVAMILPGDAVSVTLPDTNEVIALNVKTVASPVEGMLKMNGLVDDGNNATFNMTRGAGYVVGHINTPTNSYTFEMHGNAGWVHESGALFTGELPAVMDPDIDHGHGHDNHHAQDDGIIVVAKGSDQSPNTRNKNDIHSE